jgi:hypothetical protein
VRRESATALKNRPDALPWLRRANRSADDDTARRAAELIEPHDQNRQEAVPKAIDSCIREGRIDLLMEWHHYWRPENKDDLWTVGPRAAKAGRDLFAESSPGLAKDLERRILPAHKDTYFHDGPPRKGMGLRGNWHIRTDRHGGAYGPVAFAYVAGPVQFLYGSTSGGHYFALGSFQADSPHAMFIACDGEVQGVSTESGGPRGVRAGLCVIVCRGNFRGDFVGGSVVLVDGDIDLSPSGQQPQESLIRASGEIRIHPDVKPVNCKIEAHAKDATAPYKFFELADVGLSLADDEEGLVVTGVKPNTPFGACGIAKGDLVRAIDDVPAGHSEEFRKKVRRALVRQGDCLLTVTRGDKTLDLPVFFPPPK